MIMLRTLHKDIARYNQMDSTVSFFLLFIQYYVSDIKMLREEGIVVYNVASLATVNKIKYKLFLNIWCISCVVQIALNVIFEDMTFQKKENSFTKW